MWRWTSRRADGPAPALLLSVGLACGLAPGAGRATLGSAVAVPQDDDAALTASLLLAVKLNGAEADEMVRAVRQPRGLALAEADWRALDLRTPAEPALVVEGQRYLLLDALPGLRWQIDEATQSLQIEAPPAAFVGGALALGAPLPDAGTVRSWGGFANYDLQWQRHERVGPNGHHQSLQGLFELGSFGPAGAGRATALLRDNGMSPRAIRLDTTWTYDRPERMASLRVGDGIGHAGAWGRAMRFGGVQYATDFSTRPGFLTFPLPSLHGEASLPSTLEVYVNNSRRLQGQVPAGPFELTDLPIVTGSGQLRVVVRDLLGREQVIQQPYYVSPALLRQGLRSFSYEVGSVREDYGVASDRYGKAFIAATERRGLTDDLTGELRGEMLGRQTALGATGLWLVPALGLVNLSAVGSHRPGREGVMLMGALEHQSERWNGSLQLRCGSRGFSQAGQGDVLAHKTQTTLALGSSWQGTVLGASVVQASSWGSFERQRLLSLNAARALGRYVTAGVFMLRDLAGSGGTTLAFSLSVALDGQHSASLGHIRRGDGGPSTRSLQLQRNAGDESGLGYQLSADRGELRRDTGQAIWQAPLATLQAGVSDGSTGSEVRLGAAGSLAWLDGSVFLARRIDGSFAVVDVGGFADVSILQENRPVARTDARGRALVSGLRGYQVNRLGVDLAGLPFDAEVDGVEVDVVPPSRSGVMVRVPVRYSRSVTFRLVDAEGAPLPAGTMLQVDGLPKTVPLGFDGRGFLSGVGVRALVRAKGPLGPCSAAIEIAAAGDDLPDLGPVSCR